VFLLLFLFLWKVLQEIVVSVGNIAPSSEIYDNNTWHDSNYGILAKFIMGKSDSYSKFESLNSVVYNLAEKISNHKAKFDEAFTQAVFNLTKSFLKSQLTEKVPTPAEKGSMVIKKNREGENGSQVSRVRRQQND
jgi:hypothetical protein